MRRRKRKKEKKTGKGKERGRKLKGDNGGRRMDKILIN